MAIVQDEGSGGDFRLIEKRFILFKFPLLTLFRHAIENPSILGNLLQVHRDKSFPEFALNLKINWMGFEVNLRRIVFMMEN